MTTLATMQSLEEYVTEPVNQTQQRDHDHVADRAVGGRRARVQPRRPRRRAREAALSKDFAVVQGIALISWRRSSIANVLVDLLYAVLDPRVALGSRAE